MAYLPKSERREALIAGALALLRREGLGRVTTRAVAAETGAAAGIVHHHFPSGEALRAEAFGRLVAADLAALDEALERLPDDALTGFALDELVPSGTDDPHWRLWCEAWDVSRADPAVASVYAQAIAGWRARVAALLARLSGRPAEDPAIAAAAWRVLALADGLSGFTLLQPVVLEPGEARERMAEALARELDALRGPA